MSSLSGRLWVMPVPIQLPKRLFGELIEEEAQCKNQKRGKREPPPTKWRIAVQ
jgi:hypothetical protein